MLEKGFAGFVNNYRPRSLTSVISKLLERVIITEYLISNNILSDAQHVFRTVNDVPFVLTCWNA